MGRRILIGGGSLRGKAFGFQPKDTGSSPVLRFKFDD